jgi:hypothetical protein
MDIVAPSTPGGLARPHAIIYKNGCQLFLPRYDQAFVQRLKRLVPPKARVFHGGVNASYTIVTPWHLRAIALAGEHFLDFTRAYTDEPYKFPGDDRHLALQQHGRQVAR